ncbi:hypothetical protein JOF53_000702 [Crossiella equi]|uniref:Cardiolipin synthase N-terminal domain-containing protein n=1 Tax=Crossiella equi TaxID=130796 RepID=A0ABS5A5F8_9PSEU|nr:hypothetical protein [Crossiella equi]MBP2471830.1 hypothetical protein [Crossiella equi]
MARLRWSELSGAQRGGIAVAAVVQVVLAAAAWYDLARRPAWAVRGRKGRWAWVIAVNFIGPLLYFRFGRREQTG